MEHAARCENGHPVTNEPHHRMELTTFEDYPKHKWMNKLANWSGKSRSFIADIQSSREKKSNLRMHMEIYMEKNK